MCEPILTHNRCVDVQDCAFTFGSSCRHVVCALFTCATRGCHEIWIENRVIHIVGITVWITCVIIHILGIILWIAWGQSAAGTASTCINLVKVLCEAISAAWPTHRLPRNPLPRNRPSANAQHAPLPHTTAPSFGIIDAGVRNSENNRLSAVRLGQAAGKAAAPVRLNPADPQSG